MAPCAFQLIDLGILFVDPSYSVNLLNLQHNERINLMRQMLRGIQSRILCFRLINFPEQQQQKGFGTHGAVTEIRKQFSILHLKSWSCPKNQQSLFR